MNVLVTGGAGFLGRHVVQAIAARGHSVRVLARRSVDAAAMGWSRLDVQVVQGDMLQGDLREAVAGVDVVVHLAAVMRGSADEQIRTAVEGTQRLADAMLAAGVKRLVLASSFSVYDWAATHAVLDETAPVGNERGRDGYSIAKMRQEQLAHDLAKKHNWSLTVLRPGAIWGRGSECAMNVGQKVGPVYVMISPGRRAPATYVENCAEAFALAVERPAAAGVYNVVDGHGEVVGSFFAEYRRRTGQHGRTVGVPYGLVMLGARLAYFLGGTVLRQGRRMPGLLVPASLASRFRPLAFNDDKIRKHLGWSPRYGYAEALERTYGPLPTPAAAPVSV